MKSARIAGGLAVLLALVAGVVRADVLPAAGMAGLQGVASGAPGGPAMSAGPGFSAPQRGPVDPSAYVVGPGDWFELSLYGPLSRELTIVVGPEGSVFLPGIGMISLVGYTLDQARTRIQAAVATQFRDVHVQVQLSRVRRMQVALTGNVKRPGPVEVPGYVRIADMLDPDLLMPNSSTRNVIIERPASNGEVRVIRADLERARRIGTGVGNPFLRDNDVVRVPVATGFLTIEGAVANPGRYEFVEGDSLSTLVALAGGALPSAIDDIVLVRFRNSTDVDTLRLSLATMMSNAMNPLLKEGDHVFVYFQPGFHELHRVSIFGEVGRPGPYKLEAGKTRLSDLVSACGGFLPDANLANIRVFRASSWGKEADPELDRLSRLSRNEMTASEYEVLRARLSARREDYRVSWDRVRQATDLDLVLEDNDVVRVDRVLPSVRIDGEVRRPGVVQFVEGRGVAEYLRLAGGYSDRAARRQVRVTRAVTGQTILARDVSSISPGDLIWVPERSDQSYWQPFQATVLVLAQIATVIIALRK